MAECGDRYRTRVTELGKRLDAPSALSERDAIRGDLIALAKALEQDLVELATLKDEAKTLVDKWKGLQSTAAPAFSVDRPIVADHIGASTFMEKGRRGRNAAQGAQARAQRSAGGVAAGLVVDAAGEV
jgi:hypothetical protein